MAVIAGQRFTTHQTTETRAVRDVKKEINLLEPDQYPLVAILNKAKNRLQVAGNWKVEWFEDTLLPRFDVLGADLTAAATSMTVTNYAYFRAGDIVRVNKSELVFVSATPSSTTVSIRRAYGTTAAAAASSLDQLHILANLSDEGEGVGAVLTTQKVPQYNYCANIKTPYKVSGRAQATEVYGKSDLDYERAKAIIEHAKSYEHLNLLGERYQDTSNETNLTAYNGALAFIGTNVKDFGGSMTEPSLEDFIRRVFRYGSKRKLLAGSSKVMTVINSYGREKLDFSANEKTYGVTMAVYKNAGRVVDLIEHPLLENDSLTDLTGLAGSFVILDLADLSFRHMRGRYMSRSEVLPGKDSTLSDFTIGEILTDGCLQLEQEKKHGEGTGVQA